MFDHNRIHFVLLKINCKFSQVLLSYRDYYCCVMAQGAQIGSACLSKVIHR